MRRVNLQCKRLHPDAILPAKSGLDEIGWDICCVADEQFEVVGRDFRFNGRDIKKGKKIFWFCPSCSHLFNTGFSAKIDRGYAMLLWDRSSMGATKHIHRLAGVIDCNYRGEWKVSLVNLDEEVLHLIVEGDKIIQGIITPVIPGIAKWVEQLETSVRGENGFGSTGH